MSDTPPPRARPTGLGSTSVSSLGNPGPSSSVSELHSTPSARELDSGVSVSELSSSSKTPPKPGAGK